MIDIQLLQLQLPDSSHVPDNLNLRRKEEAVAQKDAHLFDNTARLHRLHRLMNKKKNGKKQKKLDIYLGFN